MRRALLGLACGMALAAPAAAASLSLGVSGGLQRPDLSREAWRWEADPRAAWGAAALLGGGRLAAGVRYENTSARQALGLDAPAPEAAQLNGHTFEVLARVELLRVAGLGATASASYGRTRWTWTPAEVAVATGSGTTTVSLEPMQVPTSALGLAVTRAWPTWSLGASAERRWSRFETAHRVGDAVVLGTETFGDWNARLELARVWTLAAKGPAR